MADIVRLEEDGVTQYIETHVKAVEGLDAKVNVQTYYPSYKTGFKDYSSGQKLDFSVVGNQVFITGAFTNISKIAAGAEVVAATVPYGCRPYKIASSPRLQGTGGSSFFIQINPSGDMTFGRYKYASADNVCDANSYLSVNMSYTTKETSNG